MKITSKILAPLLVAAFIIGIGGTMISGDWITTSTKEPVKYTDGDFAGQYNPGDIRGSYTFSDVEAAFGVPVSELAEAFGFAQEEDPALIQIKSFEDIYGEMEEGEVGTDSMRLFVALYKGLPYTPEDTTLLPAPALRILRDNDKIEEETFLEWKEKSLSLTDINPERIETASEDHEETSEEEPLVKGNTLFKDVLDWGVTQEEIEEILTMEMGPKTMSIRSFCMEQGIEFSTVKTALQSLVDSKE